MHDPMTVGVVVVLVMVLLLYLRSKSDLRAPRLTGAEAKEPEGWKSESLRDNPYLDQLEGEVDGVPYEAFLDEKEFSVLVELDDQLAAPDGLILNVLAGDTLPPGSPFATEISELLKLGATCVVVGEVLDDETCADFPASSRVIDRAFADKVARYLVKIKKIAARIPRAEG